MAAPSDLALPTVATPKEPGGLQSVLLVALLAASLGGALAWHGGWRPVHVLTGLGAYLVLGSAIAAVASLRLGRASFGLANQVTLLRAALVCLIGGTLVAGAGRLSWSVAGLVAAALMLDGIDGWLARRLRAATAFGARFDLEIDALLLLVLALLAWRAEQVGAWVLAIGLMRYAFVAAGWLWPALRADLPPSVRRKVVCVLQGGALLACLLPPVPAGLAAALAAGALAALTLSFALDVASLVRRVPPDQGRA